MMKCCSEKEKKKKKKRGFTQGAVFQTELWPEPLDDNDTYQVGRRVAKFSPNRHLAAAYFSHSAAQLSKADEKQHFQIPRRCLEC